MGSKNGLRTVFILFNVVFLLTGMGISGVGAWIRADVSYFENLIGSSLVPIVAYILMGAGGFIMLVALAGCMGAMKQYKKLLVVYFILLLLIYMAEAAAGILAFIAYDRVNVLADQYIGEPLRQKYGYAEYKLITTAIDFLQKQFECCGFVSAEEWSTSKYYTDPNTANMRNSTVVPRSCCINSDEENCNAVLDDTKTYMKGCASSVELWIKTKLLVIGAVGIGISVVELFGMVTSCCLIKS
ncbi:hypothetical protein CHS0354_034201 [Potamilus streckersoni]|uniref:Tetraspanin n=1 Tax=Potamilus streckersoni TaxID=2493646 RepID=A0AAE0T2I6_9BIVA|nr:hypothetical protein CHS0354_034201 [Potamilus streckersoni]